MAKLRGPTIDARGNERQSRLEFRVAVALNDLCAERGWLETEVFAHSFLDPWIKVRVCPDGSAQFSNADARLNAIQPFNRTSEFIEHQRQLQTEGHRFRVDAVAAPDHRSELELLARCAITSRNSRKSRSKRSEACAIWTASVVSRTSDEVMPWCIQRAAGPT